MAKYGEKASEKVEKAMHERKEGTLKSGRSGKKVKSRKQAIAIGLSEARRAGAKVPPRNLRRRRSKLRNPCARLTVLRKSKRRRHGENETVITRS
jgi:hypothetical protein